MKDLLFLTYLDISFISSSFDYSFNLYCLFVVDCLHLVCMFSTLAWRLFFVFVESLGKAAHLVSFPCFFTLTNKVTEKKDLPGAATVSSSPVVDCILKHGLCTISACFLFIILMPQTIPMQQGCCERSIWGLHLYFKKLKLEEVRAGGSHKHSREELCVRLHLQRKEQQVNKKGPNRKCTSNA